MVVCVVVTIVSMKRTCDSWPKMYYVQALSLAVDLRGLNVGSAKINQPSPNYVRVMDTTVQKWHRRGASVLTIAI